jgi:hypothetical protein
VSGYTGSKAGAGRGSVFSISADGTTYTEIGECMDASFAGGQWGTADVTNFDSTGNDEFITTTRDNGAVNLKGNVVDTDPGQVLLIAAYNSGATTFFKNQLLPGPGETTGRLYTFKALVQSYEETIETRSAIGFTAKLKISGVVTRTAGS